MGAASGVPAGVVGTGSGWTALGWTTLVGMGSLPVPGADLVRVIMVSVGAATGASVPSAGEETVMKTPPGLDMGESGPSSTSSEQTYT